MKTIIYFLLIMIFILSCSGEMQDKYNAHNNYDNKKTIEVSDENTNDYSFEEGVIKTSDEVDLYYRLFLKEINNGLIVLVHDKNSSLEEWNILIDTFLDLDYSLIVYDLRGHGKSENSEDESSSRMIDDLNLIVDLAETRNLSKLKKVIFIGNGLSGNIALYSSPKYCDINSYFVMLSPVIESQETAIAQFNNYCENSKYLYLYSKKSFETINKSLYLYNYKNIETFIDNTNNYMGIDLLLNNSIFLLKVKNIINSK